MAPFKVSSLYEQGSGRLNEDRLLIADTRFAVFDGASAVDESPYVSPDGATGGFFAADIACAAFIASSASLVECARAANENLATAMRQAGLNPARKRSAWCAAFAAVDITDHSFEWAQIADCMILIVYADGSVRPLIEDYDHDVDTLVGWKDLAKAGLCTRNELWSAIRARAAAKREMMNVDYGILSGDLAAINFVRHGREMLRDVRAVILFTDGLFPLKADPAKPDDLASLGTSIVREGLQRVAVAVREMERADPECIRLPRFKTHDDIAAVSIVLRSEIHRRLCRLAAVSRRNSRRD